MTFVDFTNHIISNYGENNDNDIGNATLSTLVSLLTVSVKLP